MEMQPFRILSVPNDGRCTTVLFSSLLDGVGVLSCIFWLLTCGSTTTIDAVQTKPLEVITPGKSGLERNGKRPRPNKDAVRMHRLTFYLYES